MGISTRANHVVRLSVVGPGAPRKPRPSPPAMAIASRIAVCTAALSTVAVVVGQLAHLKAPGPIRTRPATRMAVAGWQGSVRLPAPGLAIQKAASLGAAKPREKTMSGKNAKSPRWTKVYATAYCPDCRVCDTGGRTATGRRASTDGVAVAARRRSRVTPLGSRVYLAGRGWLPVDDTGGGVGARQIDLRLQDHREAVRWGRRLVSVRFED